MYSIVTPRQFLRQARKFFKKHPELKSSFATLVSDLQNDPLQPHLHLHPLCGKLTGCHAISLTHSYRITLILLITEQEITLLDIGSHDQVYR